MYFHGCELHHCPDWDHSHTFDHYGNPNDKISLTYSTPSIHVRETSEPMRFTLKLLRRKWKAIHVVVKGANFDERGCVVALSEITEKPNWISINLPVEYRIET